MNALRLALEKTGTQGFFQQLDLSADGAGRHIEFGRCLGKALVAGGGFESANGIERRQSSTILPG
jgi:hypothetical protein